MLLAFSLALAGAPTWPTLTAEEKAKFDAGELVIRADTSTPKTLSTGIVKVSAPPELLWEQFLDFPARLPENPTLKMVEEYGRLGPDDWYVHFELSIFGIGVTIYDHWTCFPAERYCTWVQDNSRTSDTSEEAGWMLIRPLGSGSEIAFHSEFISNQWAPSWIRRWLANDSMVNVLDKLRLRTERIERARK
jgi:hypothetical protein